MRIKIPILLALAGLASGSTLPASAQDNGKVDPKIAQQIRTLAANYDAAINKHDPAAVAAFYAQDAVRATALNDGTFYGRPAIEKPTRNTIFNVGRSATIPPGSIG